LLKYHQRTVLLLTRQLGYENHLLKNLKQYWWVPKENEEDKRRFKIVNWIWIKTLTTCWTSRAITESSSSGLIVFNGGARALRSRDDKSPLVLLVDSSASELTNFLTTVLISVLGNWCLLNGFCAYLNEDAQKLKCTPDY
jgi:hypothetical protein